MDWACWNWGWGTMMFGGLGMLAFWGLLFGLVVWAARGGLGGSGSASHPHPPHTSTSPLEILQARYARGEISRDEYETILRDLKSS